MNDKELIMTITRDLLIKMLEDKQIKLSVRGGDEALDDLGRLFNHMASKISETLKGLDL